MSFLYKQLLHWVPDLKHKLLQADMPDSPKEFIKKTFTSAFILSFGICVLFIGGMIKDIKIVAISFPIAFIFLFNYLLKVPDVKIRQKEAGISKEIVFATRFLMIEIESGVPVYNAFINVGNVYPVVGTYFKQIIDQIDMGTSMEEAINETLELVPSSNLRRILWQILNSIKTGADVTGALNAVLEQIVNEQKIEVEEYGRKLNPLAMFYMLIAVIMPSLGSAMIIIFASFIGFSLKLPVLLTIAGLLGFMQFMFYGLIKSSRPAVEL
jgi:flagellar protein FlaJ